MSRWSTLFGNVPQWISALAGGAVATIAILGVNRAVPYLENQNLREQNARLAIDQRGLEDRRRELEVTNQRLSEEASQLGKLNEHVRSIADGEHNRARLIAAYAVCLKANDEGTFVLLNVMRQRLYLKIDTLFSSPGSATQTRHVDIRSILDAMYPKDAGVFLDKADSDAYDYLMRSVIDAHKNKLDLVILPSVEGGRRVQKAELQATEPHLEVALEFKGELVRACSQFFGQVSSSAAP